MGFSALGLPIRSVTSFGSMTRPWHVGQARFNGSGVDRMDGTHVERGAIITGLDKLGRLQQSPYAFYYSALNREAMEADLILVLGGGLADLHLNTFLKAARRARPDVPILYVGYWGREALDFYSTIHFELEDRDIALFHELSIDLVKTSLKHASKRTTAGLWMPVAKRRCGLMASNRSSLHQKHSRRYC